jgi:predicted transcriptional regulator of viral defense system
MPSLTPRETAVLAWADRARRTRLTVREMAEVIGLSAAPKTASSLARKGVLDRVGRGVYVVRPLRAVAAPWSISALAAVAALLEGQRYYVGGPAALALHRLTTQAYGSVVDVFVTGHRRARELGGARVVFHEAPPDLFGLGLTAIPIEGAPLSVSDAERTLLDLLEYPRMLGIPETLAAVAAAATHVDLARLLEYAKRWPNLSTCQRLGVVLERAGTPPDALRPLEDHVRGAGVTAMLRAAPRRGPTHPVWRVVENDGAVATHTTGANRTRRRRRAA